MSGDTDTFVVSGAPVASSADAPFVRHVLTTPLHLDVAAQSRTNLWVRWNGYTTADVLTSVDEEYRALRFAAALGDISPLVKYRIDGPGAAGYLRRLVAGDPSALAVNEAMPVVMCEDRGSVVADGLLFRLGETEYRLVTEETHLDWLIDSATGMNVSVEDVSARLAAISLQGPLSCRVLAAASFPAIADLPPYAMRRFNVAGVPGHVSRTGNSGDLGYELWVDAGDAPDLWNMLLHKGAPFGLRAIGFRVREIARIEASIPRAGVDELGAFAAVDAASASNPFELGFASLVDLEGGHFTGRDALRVAGAAPQRRILAPLAVEWPEPLPFAAIRCATGLAGLATSTAFSPSLGINLALAMLRADAVAANAALHVVAEIRQELDLRVVEAPVRLIAGPALVLPARYRTPAPLGPCG
jgi:aminomethyltransferase